MTQLIPTRFKNTINITSKASFLLVLLFALFSKTNLNAQCIGPYARFESISAAGTTPPSGFTSSFSTIPSFASPVFSNSGQTPRSGVFFMLSTKQNTWIKTPSINYAKTFSFYVKTSATATGAFSLLVEYSTDGFVTPININTVAGATIPVINNTYQLVSVTLPSNTNTNVQFRITDTTLRTPAVGGSSGSLVFDDFSWDTYKSDGTLSSGYPENTIVASIQSGNGTAIANCTGGTINVDSNAVYNFYDNGGTDQYNTNQTNQVTFKPTGIGYTAGDRVRIQFVTYTGAASDKIEVWDDNGSALNATTNLLTHTATTIPVVSTYISSISTDGSITIKFTSDAATNAAGFNIKVDCVRCPTPTGLVTTVVGASNASLTWDITSAANYDVYYSTSNTPPTGAVTPQGSNLTTNSYSITGLTPGSYYVWVRSRCGSLPDSYSPWSPSLNFIIASCSFALANSPSTVIQNLCKNATNATALTASASGGIVSTYQWFSNTTATTIGGTAVGTNSSNYTPLTTTVGTLYYYCVITSTLGCTVTTAISGAVNITAPTAVPSAAAATAITTSAFSANWNLIAGVTAYYLDVSTSSTFTSFVTGYNNLLVGNVNTWPVAGLGAGTTYYYRVSTNNNSCGTSYSSTISLTTIGVTYCIPTAPSSVTTFVNSFSTTAGITNITNNITGFTTGGYANYTTQSCSQFPSSLINYSITSVRTDSTDQTFFYYIWIDWNQDGDFTDVGETILATTTYLLGPFTGAFAIPNGQTPGNYRMRVSTSWVGANTSCSINGSGLGEMEDYTLIVVPVPPCAPSTPSALTTASITGTSAIITWTDAGLTPNSVYNYYYSTSPIPPTPTSTPSGTVTGVNSVALTGLTVNGTYYFWVRSNCGTPNPWVMLLPYFITVNQDVINMANGSFTSCNVIFYDSAGPVNSYSNNEIYTYTFYPSSPSSKLKVTFNSFVTENSWDGLSIYNGNSTTAPLISSGLPVGILPATCPAGSFYGTHSPGTIISTATDGSLTFKFTSDTSVTYAGWNASIVCVTVPKITSFTPTSTCVGTTPIVTLTGSNFTNATSVKFNGVSALTYTVNSDTSITVTLPALATTGFITVSNAQATGTSSTIFTVNPIPSTPIAYPPGPSPSICSGSSITLGASALGFPTSVLSQDFNAGPWPAGWIRTINGGRSPGDFRTTFEATSSGNTWTGAGHSGFCSYFYSTLVGSAVSGDMISPTMDMTTYSASTLTFWIYNSAGSDYLKVYANNNGGAYSQIGSASYNSFGSWTQLTISLNNFVGVGFNSVRIKITGTSDVGVGSSDIGVDDIIVTGYTNPILSWAPATGLSATNILNPDASPITDTSYTLTSTYGNGCSSSSAPVTITVKPRPTITFSSASASTTLCYSPNSQTVQLSYSAVTGNPVAYSTTSNDSSLGFDPVDGEPLTLSTISINVPANTVGGTYTGNLIVTNTDGCESLPFTYLIIIKPKLSITTAPSVQSLCGSVIQTTRPLVFTATTGSPTTYSINWNALPANSFAPVINSNLVSSPIYITVPGGTLGGTYTGTITVQNNGCESSGSPFTVTINQQPTIILDAAAATLCLNASAQTTTISYNNPYGTPDKYKIVWSAAALSTGFTNVAFTSPLTTPFTNPLVISVPAGVPGGTYTGELTVANTGCQSPPMTFTVSIGKAWNGSISTDWSNASNWNPIGVPTDTDCVSISSGTTFSPIISANAFSRNLTINTAATLTVNSGFTLKVLDVVKTYGTLTFQDGSSLYQPTDVSNSPGIYNGGNIGNINYSRITQPINRYDFNYWSTPVSPQTLFDLSPLTLSDKYFYYNTSIDNWSTISGSANMTPGQGYIIRGPQSYDLTLRQTFTGLFTGVPNNGTIATPIASNIYNLIGNPYPSAISADLFLSNALNTSSVEGTIYLWTHNTAVTNLQYTSDDYAVYNYLGGTGTAAPSNGFNTSIPNGKIASGESFFIKGINTGGSATFLNSMRLSGNNNQFFKNNSSAAASSPEEKHRIWIGVNDANGAYKQTLVGYASGATSGLDRGYDGELLSKTPACIYTLSATTALSIQGRALPFEISDRVPVGFHADTNGTFTISLVDFDGLFAGQDIFLEDKLLNVIQDLKASNYTFVSNAGTFEDRFVLRYTNSTLNTNASIFSEQSVIVYKNNQNIMINANNTILESIEVFDIRGRELFNQKDIHSSHFEIANFVSSQQVLLVKVTSEDGRVVTKKIIY